MHILKECTLSVKHKTLHSWDGDQKRDDYVFGVVMEKGIKMSALSKLTYWETEVSSFGTESVITNDQDHFCM